ncbi:hypothetical protein K450DRAFT_272597 [Umbelopsis ramanniana AG]|uniref:Uncharacterized protein n=1 Tax=Umbelopsis ramanniana AG TaxID=1314678 RepID=A0AAD5E9B7_UMBRA|nr:uncharacterized protein K450DRAFT_272597 [Umbelopsis ramanniana AG]KAI8578756.1 hypothetical protein K450DRAFT_272597 [Umbelopsis ramanniana AG]
MVHNPQFKSSSPGKDCESIAEAFPPRSRYSGLTRRVYCVPLIFWLIAGTVASIGLICGLSLFLLNGTREVAIKHEQNVIKAQTGELMGDTMHRIKHINEMPEASSSTLEAILPTS